MPSFLTWLLGVLSIVTGVYCAMFFPDDWILPQKIVIGSIGVIVSGWCYTSIIPTRFAGFPEDVARSRAVTTLILIAVLQLLRPAWLSGSWFGWASPFIPALLLIAFIASVMRIFRLW